MRLTVVAALVGVALLGGAACAATPFADCKLDRSNLDGNIAACSKLLQSKAIDIRRRAFAFHNRGLAFWRKGDLSRALQDVDASIKLDSRWAFRYQDRAEIYYQLRRFNEAVGDFTSAIRLDGSRAFRFHARASALRETGRLDEALQDFTRAIDLDRDHDFRFFDRGNVYLAKSNYAKAISDFNDTLRLNPRFAPALYQKCAAKLGQGNAKEGLIDCDEAIRTDSADANAYKVRAAIKEMLGDFRGALEDVNSWQALNPGDSDISDRRKRLEALIHAPSAPAAVPVQAPAAVLTSEIPSSFGKRVALVIGNSGYPGSAALRNPLNDAEDVSAVLRKIGFKVTEGKDLTLAGFSETLSNFNKVADRAEVALFYYSGHGMQFDDRNWLLPVDTRLGSIFEARRYNVPLQEIISELEARSETTLVFLDACRNNPLVENMKSRLRAEGRSFDDSRGLGRFDVRSPQTLVVFATRANMTASDGSGRNSPFTTAFLRHIPTPGVEIEVLMKRVTASVSAQTEKQQQPERLSRLEQEFYFVPAK